MEHGTKRYRWFAAGDLNGFFGLMFDNLTVLSFLAGILILGFQFPADIVYTRMFPGTALGVLLGDLVYTWMALRLARRTGSETVTAMPLGLDTPSTIGIALTVLGPAFKGMTAEGMPVHDAAMATWYLGMATLVLMGVVKVVFSFLGGWVLRIVPQAGLLGSLAGIGLALIGAIPLVDVFGVPIVGLVSLGIVLVTVVARVRLPWNVPGVLASIVIGTLLYHFLGATGWAGGAYSGLPPLDLHVALPLPTLDFIHGIVPALKYLPIAIPFGLLTIVGGINVTESARVAGDGYRPRSILLTEAVATLVAGICGGVAQTTPYIGHPAYKRMGARAGYTLMTGIFIGLGGVFGLVPFFVELIPRAALAPILVFVALEIVVQAFRACPPRHAPAVALAIFPTVLRLITIKLGDPEAVLPETFLHLLEKPGKALPDLLVTVALGNGFIITAMLWGALLAELIDHRLRTAALYLAMLGGLSFFGIVHSALPDGLLYFPWTLGPVARRIPYEFAAAYLLLGGAVLLLSIRCVPPAPVDDDTGH